MRAARIEAEGKVVYAEIVTGSGEDAFGGCQQQLSFYKIETRGGRYPCQTI